MKFTKIALTTVFLSLCPQILLAQETSLSRDEAGRQIKAALANNLVKLHFDLELPPYYDPQLSARLLKLITGPDLGPNENQNQPYNQRGAIFDGLRSLWKWGVIDHFVVDSNNRPTAILKDEYKSFCTPENKPMPGHSETLLGCDAIIAEKRVEGVTGIRSGYDQGREIRIAEFNEKVDLTDFGKLLAAKGLYSYAVPKEEAHFAQALFVLYDDGWRIAQIAD